MAGVVLLLSSPVVGAIGIGVLAGIFDLHLEEGGIVLSPVGLIGCPEGVAPLPLLMQRGERSTPLGPDDLI